MRVIITSPSLNPKDNVSGMSAVTRFITANNRSCQYIHFTLGKKDGEARDYRWLGRTLTSYIQWIRVLFTERRAIVHFNLALDRRSLVRDSPLIVVARWFRRRVVIHIHGGELFASQTMPPWLKRITAIALGNGPVIVLSDTEQEILRARFPKAGLVVLPNCVELGEPKTFPRSCHPDEPLTILFLGRICVTKGIHVLYEALAAAAEKGLRFRFTMAGAGPDSDLYVAKFRELLGEQFVFRGIVAGEAKLSLLRECQVFILPSLFEGLPMALLESMAFGVVPITTAVGSIPSVITHGHNGLFIQKNDPSAIVAAIEWLSADGSFLQTLSLNGQESIAQTCKPDAYMARLRVIYQYD
jgi:glycosyltransferase involved in cell wall biosynthesis